MKKNKQIGIISFSVFSERFSFWGMQAVLILFLIQSFSQPTSHAIATVGVFGAISYAFSLLGGILADKLLGHLRACLLGISLCIVGNIILFFANSINYLNLGLSCLLVGAGLFSSNSNSLIRSLYEENLAEKERGFLIACIAANLSGTLGPLIYGIFAAHSLWKEMFISSVILNVLAGGYFFSEARQFISFSRPISKLKHIVLVPIICVWIVASFLLMSHLAWMNVILMLGVGVLFGMGILLYKNLNADEISRVVFLLLLLMILIIFYMCVFQIYSSITLFISKNVDRYFWGWTIPVPVFAALQCTFFMIFAPVVQQSINLLQKKGFHLTLIMKIEIGLLIGTIGFVFFAISEWTSVNYGMSNMSWIILANLCLGLGEVFILPPILAAVATLSPQRFSATFMGVFSIALAVSSYLGSVIAKSITDPIHSTYTGSLLDLNYTKIALLLFGVAIAIKISFQYVKQFHENPFLEKA